MTSYRLDCLLDLLVVKNIPVVKSIEKTRQTPPPPTPRKSISCFLTKKAQWLIVNAILCVEGVTGSPVVLSTHTGSQDCRRRGPALTASKMREI